MGNIYHVVGNFDLPMYFRIYLFRHGDLGFGRGSESVVSTEATTLLFCALYATVATAFGGILDDMTSKIFV